MAIWQSKQIVRYNCSHENSRQELMVDVEHSSQREWTRETKQKWSDHLVQIWSKLGGTVYIWSFLRNYPTDDALCRYLWCFSRQETSGITILDQKLTLFNMLFIRLLIKSNYNKITAMSIPYSIQNTPFHIDRPW